jgi:nitrate reductase gamma subunit
MSNYILFVVFPYLAFFIAVAVGLYRYFTDRFSYSSFSSQFLENRQLFWGSVPWHYGIVMILLAHVIAAFFPGFWQNLLGEAGRLYLLEITGIVLGIMVIIGLVLLILRRVANSRLFAVTSTLDWVLLLDLLFQVVLGVYIAITYRWGGLWYLHTAVPWLASLVKLNPDISTIVPLPLIVKLHYFNAFVVIGLFPFTRLVHIFTLPLGYLWKPYQRVIWNRAQ